MKRLEENIARIAARSRARTEAELSKDGTMSPRTPKIKPEQIIQPAYKDPYP
jgi:hypothetical protein